jgi:hypothetical protein
MPEMNPIGVIAECIEKCKATTDRDQIAHYVSEALGFMQVDEEPENDAFALLGGAIDDAARQDPMRCAALLEVWTDLEQQRRVPLTDEQRRAGRSSTGSVHCV